MVKVCFFVIIAFSLFHTRNSDGKTYSFDASLLKRRGEGVDLTLFENGGQLPGIYPVDIFLNGTIVGSEDIFFHAEHSNGKPYLKACLSEELLMRYGVKTEKYPKLFLSHYGKKDERQCADLSVIPQATEEFLFEAQKLVLSIPQVAIRSPLRGVASDLIWEDGISTFLLNWQVEAGHSEFQHYEKTTSDNFWVSLEPGINIGPWRIRNLTTLNKSSGQVGKWESSYIRAERGLNNIKSRLTLGEDYTPADIFASVPFRGVMLGTDENMIPYNQRGFAPVIRGIARTQARIEIRQNGYLIQSQTVAAGPFALTDLPITGSGGEFQVTIFESDGAIQSFNVPFTTPAIALREGYLKYNISAGQYRSSDESVEKAYLWQATAMYGLPRALTVFGGVQTAEHYQAAALGVGLSLGNMGAASLDTIYSRGQQKGYDFDTGNSWRIRYDKSFELTDTSFSAASYQYSNEGYHELSDILDTYRSGANFVFNDTDRKRRRITININQSLGPWGFIGLSGGRDEYKGGDRQDYIGASYSMSWKDISFSVNWTRNRNVGDYFSNRTFNEDTVGMWMSIPLKHWLGKNDNDVNATAQIQHSTRQNTRYEMGLNGRAFDQKLYWDIREQIVPGSKYDADTSRLNMRWSGSYGELVGMYSYNSHTRQMNAGMSGSIAMHSEGITFGQRFGDTMALIAAPGVRGASVGGWPGVSTDSRGYALVSYITPYQENIITLDPTTFPENAEVLQTDTRVVPTKGAVVRAKFKTRVGNRAVVRLARADGTPLPFGTVVTLEGKTEVSNSTGVVDDKGMVYLSGLSEAGKLKAQWGMNSHCYANYRLPVKKGPAGLYLTSAVCI
ncbi:TPA: aggregative adherence fimbria 3 usher protein Agg3C [Escherichia coli]|nr:aggregative adherence fimbria 3 usher protein Agg3C [Escherichia coli]